MLLACVACGILTLPARSVEECNERYDFGWVDGAVSPAPETGSSVLEQRVLQNDLVVWAELVSVEFKAVENRPFASELKRSSMDYYLYENSDYKYTLLGEVELRVLEYLRGEGPDLLTAIVEGQVVFDSSGAEGCAKIALEAEVGPLFGSKEGIALLKSTSDPNLYHLGQAHEDFDGQDGHHSTWLPYENGSFDSGGSDGWISLSEVRRRVSNVIEEYTRSDNDKWRNCVYSEYFAKDRDPWAYRGVDWPYHLYRDHDIIFNGEHLPVPAGAVVWDYPDPNYGGARIEAHMRLEGEAAHLFDVAYHPGSEVTLNTWRGASGGSGFYLAIWHRPNEEQWTGIFSGHVITAVEDLEEGEYRFNLLTRYGGDDFVDCGQDGGEPQQFRVIVDQDRPTVPPAPTNVQAAQDQDGWTITWDPVDGTERYWVKVYRRDGDELTIDSLLGTDTEDPQHHIRLSDMKGCGDVVYIEIWSRGDGTIYLRDFGKYSEPTELRTEPCPP